MYVLKNVPIISPLWENAIFVVSDSAEKAEIFNNFFASQCTPPPLIQVLSYLHFN